MNANSARVQMRPPSGGSSPHIRALCALALGGALALLAACNGGGGDDDSSTNANGASAGNAGSSTTQTPTVAPPSGGAQGSAKPSQQVSTGPGGPRTTVDAGDAFPHCADGFDDEDGGVSPYLDSCAIDERFGVFVNPNVGPDADADGSRAHPYGTLLHAVAAAVNAGKHVFACEGTYEEPLRIGTALANGLHVYGGLSCDTFALVSADARSHVHATSDGAALTIADTREVVIERFTFEDAPAADPKPGTSYVGALISNARLIRLRDVELNAADGERGQDGAPPDAEAASDGTTGDDGGNACSARPNPGGSLATSKGCRSDQNATSGSGGGGGEGTGNGGMGTWNGFPQVAGESSDSAWSCTQGQGLPYPANPGYPGNAGNGGAGFGALLGTGFVGFGGQKGGDGSSGQGGGGGGGAKAPTSCAGGGTAVGASGGGGGSGGCGGKGGEGGGPGGQSIGLLIINSNVTVEHAAVHYGSGGDGGTGALGQKGGKGAPGGKGGKGSSGSHDACDGAAGAYGGDGGNGGGGNGGHAIGVLFAGDAPTLVDVTDADPPDSHHGGKPGTGPIETLMQSVGTPGETRFVFEF
jgi:hypothetical protein